jgi:hypothetical protein
MYKRGTLVRFDMDCQYPLTGKGPDALFKVTKCKKFPEDIIKDHFPDAPEDYKFRVWVKPQNLSAKLFAAEHRQKFLSLNGIHLKQA